MHEALIEIGLGSHRLEQPSLLVMLAEAYGRLGQVEIGLNLIGEAFALVEATDQRCWEAEIHRTRGNLLALRKEAGAAEAVSCFERAIAVARSQSAKCFELRAATSLARLRRDEGKRIEARDLLAPVYDWFTEGFDTADLKDAKALLRELSSDQS